MVGHNGKLDTRGESGSLLARPGDGKKLEFDHSVTFFDTGEVSRTEHERLPISVSLFLLEEETETVQPLRKNEHEPNPNSFHKSSFPPAL